jgi:integrase
MICGACTPHQITPLHLHSLVARWKAVYANATAYALRGQLRRLLRNIGNSIGRPDLPDELPTVRVPRPRTNIAEPGEIDALLAVSPAWMRCIILLAAHAGLRRSDCLAVAPIHYNAENRTLTLEQQRTKFTVAIPITEELAKLLEAAPAGSPATPFYALHRGSPITAPGLLTAWWRLKKKAGIDRHLWLHDLRRTLAVSLYEVSKDLRVVEQMLGHQSLTATARYLEHRDPAKLRPYLDALFIPKGRVQ